MSNDKHPSSRNGSAYYRRLASVILIAAGLIAVLPLGLYFSKFFGSFSSDHATWAQFGDYFGGVLNPAIAFLALYGLVTLIRLESEALETAKRELSATSQAFNEQNLNDRFFKMLDLLVSTRKELAQTTREGHQNRALLGVIEGLRNRYVRGDITGETLPHELIETFNELAKHEQFRSHVRVFGATFDFISRASLGDHEKLFYFRALSSVIGDIELFCVGLWIHFQGRIDDSVAELWEPFNDFAGPRLVESYRRMLNGLGAPSSAPVTVGATTPSRRPTAVPRG